MTQLSALLAGLGFGFSLIVAIGALNAFVLRQGLLRRHVGVVVAICTLCDVVLISAGVVGVGYLLEAIPRVVHFMRLGGAIFLFAYGAMAISRALRPKAMQDLQVAQTSLVSVIAATLALIWLNPHVYLDTVILLGSMANTHEDERLWFGAGASVASAVWFCCLGYGARWIRPLFTRPSSWRALDIAIAATMFTMGATLTFAM